MQTIKVLSCAPRESPVHRIREALIGSGDIALVSHSYTEADSIRLSREWRPHVLLLDATSFNANDVGTLIRVNASSPSTKVLVFAAAFTEQFVLRALRHGASGCLRLGTSAQDVRAAIKAVHAGELWAARKIVSHAYQELLAAHACHELPAAQDPVSEPAADCGARLSPRQLEIASWMRRGMTNKEIGRRLGISDMTVKTHAHNIFHKLEISGRMHLFGLTRTQQIAAPVESSLPAMPLMALRVRGNPPKRHARSLNGNGPSSTVRAAEDHPPEPAAA